MFKVYPRNMIELGNNRIEIYVCLNRVFLGEFFNYDVPKNRTSFPMIEITDLVEELVNA